MKVFAIFLLLFFLFGDGGETRAFENGCLHCHQGLKEGTPAGLAFAQWKGSIHDRAGVTCDRCHGGDPASSVYQKAHRGIVSPRNPESPVSRRHVPKLCGGCHPEQWKEFSRSRHSRALKRTETTIEGPTCITCHGSMHTSVLDPGHVAAACRKCHNEKNHLAPRIPQEAHATLDLIFYAKNTIAWSREFLDLARKQGYPLKKAGLALANAERQFHLAEVKWHSFDFDEILKQVDDAYHDAKESKRLADLEVTAGVLKKRTRPSAP